MGTRNLTMVIKDEKVKVAQYGQWDGDPGGQGKACLEFLRKVDLTAFKFQLEKCRFIDDKKNEEIDAFMKSIGSTDGWMTMPQAAQYKNKYPYLSRDNGADILNLVNESKEDEIWLHDSSNFVNDSLFCEWAYVIDLDKNTFEVYKGFNTRPLHKHERFYKEEANERGYFPVRNIKIYMLDDLPSNKEFIALDVPEEEG